LKLKLLGIGEVLWDLLPGGRQLGGAPANFAYHASALGAHGIIVSRIGPDALGTELLATFQKLGLDTSFIEIDPAAATGTVSVQVASDGQPQFAIQEPVAWDAIGVSQPARAIASQADAICFGTLAQRHSVSRQSIRTLVRLSPPAALRILDVNLRQNYYSPELIAESLGLANLLKVNDAELPRIGAMFGLEGDNRSVIERLAERFDLQTVALTRGAHGSLLYSKGFWHDHPGVSGRVVDTVGAGDSFTAAMTIGLLAGWPLEIVNARANEVAAVVCAHAGATPPIPDPVSQTFRQAQSVRAQAWQRR